MKEEKKKTLIEFKLGKDETLRCDSCYRSLSNQKVHLYLDVNDGLDDAMCEACFKKDQNEADI